MKTYALIGESGTGKSYNSIRLAAKYKLDYIIDDGILVCKNKILAGSSAKRELSLVSAIKRAVFTDNAHCDEVKNAIRNLEPNGILVLGTSEKMVERIRTRLELPKYTKIIKIEDVSTEEEIQKAKLNRQNQGKHVIPVPVMEIRKTFSGYFLDPLRVFRKNIRDVNSSDKSIVRPTYSYMGDFSINDTVLCTLASYEASKCKGVDKVLRISVDKTEADVVFNIDVSLNYGVDIKKCSSQIKSKIKKSVEKYASIYTDAVNVNVKSLTIEHKE